MNDEKTSSGTPVNTTVTAAAPKPAPVMDVVPPPGTTESPVVAAPPEQSGIPQISDEIAEQIAAESSAPPPPEPAETSNPEPAPSSGNSAMATPPPEDTDGTPPTSDADSPSDLIQAEINHEEAAPVAAAAQAHKTKNPALAAVIATVFITVLLAGLAVFAYMSTQS